MARKPKTFRIADHRDTIAGCIDAVAPLLMEANPDFDPDGFETEFRTLLLKHSKSGMGEDDDSEVLSSVKSKTYNFAGDLLCLAHTLYRDGKPEAALKLAVKALDDQSSDDLMTAIEENNNGSHINQEAAKIALPDNAAEVVSRVIASLTTLANSDEYDDEISEEGDDDEESDEIDFEEYSDEDEMSDDEGDEESEDMSEEDESDDEEDAGDLVASSNRSKQMRILANKLSLSGTPNARRTALKKR